MKACVRVLPLFILFFSLVGCGSSDDDSSGEAADVSSQGNIDSSISGDSGSNNGEPATIPANNQPPDDVTVDPGCVADCAGKNCGDDGCGGSCGTCSADSACSDEGVCETPCGECAPDMVCGLNPEAPTLCVGGECGDVDYDGLCIGDIVKWCQEDVLYSYDCSILGENHSCGEGEQVGFDCVCTPSCDGKVCGDDGCGGSCGDCPNEGEVCTDQYVCAPADSVVGNICENPIEITGVPYSHSADTNLFSDLYNTDGGCDNVSKFGEGLAEVVYHFKPTKDETYRFALTETAGPTVIYVATDCAALGTTCMGTSDDLYGGGAYSIALTGGVDYLVFVDGLFDGDTGPYTLEVDICAPSCDGKSCGDDGCGGSCGDCGDSEVCNSDGACEFCAPSCAGLSCGPDGCGGSCGQCEGEDVCLEGLCTSPEDACGTCAPGTICGVNPDSPQSCVGGDCGDVDLVGQCDGSVMSYCYENQLFSLDCDLFPQYECQYIESEEYFACACMPACDGKDCGPDGCDGSCGTCADGYSCTEDGLCVDAQGCDPQCDNKECGSDGCGGFCGECSGGVACTEAGLCEEPVDCGECAPNTSCGASTEGAFYCGGDDCGDVPTTGVCFGDVAAHCDDNGKLSSIDCAVNGGVYNSCGLVGGDDTLYGCICTPSCAQGQECGDDGCGGSCGECTDDLICGAQGTCLDPVNDVMDVSGYRLTQKDSEREFIIPAGSVLLPGGYAIVARECSRSEFETFWNVTLPEYVLFFNSVNTFPMMNGGESYALYAANGDLVDGPTVKMSSKECHQRLDGEAASDAKASWKVTEDGGVPEIANPGSGSEVGKALFISEFCDVVLKGAFKHEFVEIRLGVAQ